MLQSFISPALPIHQKCRGGFKERSQKVLGFRRRKSFLQCRAHQLEPPVARGLVDREGSVAHPQLGMAALLDVAGRSSEPEDEEVAEPLFGSGQVAALVHRAEKIVARDLAVEGGHQTEKALFADGGENFGFLHLGLPPR